MFSPVVAVAPENQSKQFVTIGSHGFMLSSAMRNLINKIDFDNQIWAWKLEKSLEAKSIRLIPCYRTEAYKNHSATGVTQFKLYNRDYTSVQARLAIPFRTMAALRSEFNVSYAKDSAPSRMYLTQTVRTEDALEYFEFVQDTKSAH